MDTSGRKAGVPLWDRLTSFENLYNAAREARRGKRFKPATARFHHDVAASLVELRDDLLTGRYRPGPYRTFTIYEPARRFISAAPYRDRVVHHALCQVMEPLFEKSFIFDSYANRIGKGTHRALDRCQEYCRRYRYVFKGDIRLFFPSIDHEILVARLARRICDPRVLALAKLIVEHSNPQPEAIAYFAGDDLFTPYERRRGLPIGNLTSQVTGGKKNGLGLGLALARQTALDHGGDLWESNKNGTGASFCLRLPLVSLSPIGI